jgi:cytochrome c-type biogenesis protein CcmF
MIAEIGHFALILALGLSLLLTFVPSMGVFTKHTLAMRTAPALALGYCFFIWLAYFALTEAFISNDFSIAYVANNSNSALPLSLRISAVWGGHEGSLLLWLAFLSSWTAAVSLASRQWSTEMRAQTLCILGAIGVGFLLFILLTSNPFARLLPLFPSEGRDLNPLLQDFALIIHPPTLYMGYVGFAVAFALAISALWAGKLDAEWAKRALPWTLVAWVFLTLGIMLGSWWAYYELGWGGWWFWDPVENASLMPWLVGTALIHSLLVTAKREIFKSWTVLLAILAFSLSLLGTFLVRSGVLTSVHSFANDPERGLFILGFLALVIGAALALYAARAYQLRSTGKFNVWSREALLLGNNILLVVACATILLSTLYPLILDLLNMGKISVGAPYFNSMFIPLFVLLMFVMGLAPGSHWSNGEPFWNRTRLIYALILSVAAGVILKIMIPDNTSVLVIIGVMVSVWLVCATLMDFILKLKHTSISHWRDLPGSYYGMVLAHIGVAITALGITLSSAYSVERDVRLVAGQQISVGPYDFNFIGTESITGPNYTGVQGEFVVFYQGKQIAVLFPERRVNNAQRMLTTKTAIDPGLFRDLYVALGEQLTNNSWAVRVYYKPFVRWIWMGAIVMALGGLCAAFWKRRK